MKVVHLAAGAGGMYCGACARDITIAKGLIAQGDDVIILPLYTPLRVDSNASEDVPHSKIFLGGINSWLQQTLPIFRSTPSWFDNLLDSPKLLLWASKFAVSVKAEELGPMTYSVLRGREGFQRKEIDKLLSYLDAQRPFSLVSITNTLLSSIAPEIKKRYQTPVVCAFQGEDSFVEAFPEEWKDKVWRKMQENVESVDGFIAPCHDAADRMARYLSVPDDKIHIFHTGMDASRYTIEEERVREPFTVGYVSAITPAKGLDILVEGVNLAANRSGKRIHLRVAGKVMDTKYWLKIQSLISQGANVDFKYDGEIDFADKVKLLHACSAYSVPSRIPEVRSMAVMEAMAAGVPVMAPAHGVFPELISITSGGALFEKENSDALADILQDWMDHPDKADFLGQSAREGINLHFAKDQMILNTRELYRSLVNHYMQ